MSTTLLQLRTKISARLKDPNNTAVSVAEVDAVINDAINQYKKKRFWFNEFEANVTLEINNPILPSLGFTVLDLFKRDGIVINYANTRWVVDKILPVQYDQINVQGTGIPSVYTYRNNQFELYYYPDSDYITTVRGLKDYAPLVATDDTNDFLEYAADLIMYEALSRLFAEFRQDTKMEAYYSARAEDQYKRQIADTNKRNKSGRVVVREF